MSWTSAPLDSLLDVDKLIEVWRAKGMVVHKVRARPNSRLHPARLPCRCPHAPVMSSGNAQHSCLYGCIYDCNVAVLFEAWHSKEVL